MGDSNVIPFKKPSAAHRHVPGRLLPRRQPAGGGELAAGVGLAQPADPVAGGAEQDPVSLPAGCAGHGGSRSSKAARPWRSTIVAPTTSASIASV